MPTWQQLWFEFARDLPVAKGSFPGCNAVAWFAVLLQKRGVTPPANVSWSELARRFDLDLTGFLNWLPVQGLRELASALEQLTEEQLPRAIGQLRHALWQIGCNAEQLPQPLCEPPKLVKQRLYAICPLGVGPPQVRAAEPSWDASQEPETIEELLARAQLCLGLELGPSQTHKGSFGDAIERALGLRHSGSSEPDWRGLVEVKSIPVFRDAEGFWQIKEDPAITMLGNDPYAKLVRVLWVARAVDDNTFRSWYYIEMDWRVERLLRRYLHRRPKGGKGTTKKGVYLHKDFFISCGMWDVLNPPTGNS